MTGTEKKAIIENAFAGIVITAQSFNPSIFTETWMYKNSVLSVDSLEGVRVFSPTIVQFQAKDVLVSVRPERMDVHFKIHEIEGNFETQRNIASRTVELLPQTPYIALGLNFDFYVILPDGQDFLTYNRSLLGTGTYQLFTEFLDPNVRFGRYFSKDYGSARLKLDIKPVIGAQNKKDMLYFSFNFHYDLDNIDLSERSAKLLAYMKEWDNLKNYSSKLVELGI